MSMRISDSVGVAILGLAMLAGCSEKPPQSAEEQTAAEGAEQIACALKGQSDFASTCGIERVTSADGTVLVVRHPDGGFRRFNLVTDGRGLVAADGSEEAVVTIATKGRVDVAVGEDRYRFPATLKPGMAKAAAAPSAESAADSAPDAASGADSPAP